MKNSGNNIEGEDYSKYKMDSSSTSRSPTFAAPKPVLNLTNREDTDYKSWDIDKLLLNLSGKTLQICLEKVLAFLYSDENELEFRDISQCLEELLVRIVKDVDILKYCYSMNGNCKFASDKIINTLKSKAVKDYVLMCMFKKEQKEEEAQLPVSILVYKKLHYAQEKPVKFQSMSSLSSTPAISRSASLDSLDSQRSSISSLPCPEHFKTYCLHRILKFIKNKTQLSFELTGLTRDEAEFVYTVFSSVISIDRYNINIGDKKLVTSLWEAVKIFGLKFKFGIRYVESSGGKKSLLLEKMPKFNNPGGAQAGKNPTKKHLRMAEKLPPVFVMMSLEKILQFLTDDAEASIIFVTFDTLERKFLKDIFNLCHSDRLKRCFPHEASSLMNEIQASYDMKKKSIFKVKIKERRWGGEIEILFAKVPCFENNTESQQASRQWYPDNAMTAMTPDFSNVRKHKPKRIYGTVSVSHLIPGFDVEKYPANQGLPLMDGLCGAAPNATENSAAPNATEKRTQKPAINFQPAGVLNSNNYSKVVDSNKDGEGMEKLDTEDKLPQPSTSSDNTNQEFKGARSKELSLYQMDARKEKLIEALSVPVKCDKAMKIMLSMGWTGGGLGTKGEGITEPLMPHLARRSGKGLGHNPSIQTVQPTYTQLTPAVPACPLSVRKTSPIIRGWFLKELLDLVVSNSETKVVKCHMMLNGKNKSFIRQAMKNFSARTKITVESPKEQELLNKIMEQYEKHQDLVVSLVIGDCKKQLFFKKYFSTLVPRIAPNTKKKEYYAGLLDHIDILMDFYATFCHTQKAYESTKFRLELLNNILNFLKKDTTKVTLIQLDKEMVPKQKKFVENCVRAANRRIKFGSSVPENAFSSEILTQIEASGFKLHVTFGMDDTSYTLYKELMEESEIRKVKEQQAARLMKIYNDHYDSDFDYGSTDDDDEIESIQDSDKTDDKPNVRNHAKKSNDKVKENDDAMFEIDYLMIQSDDTVILSDDKLNKTGDKVNKTVDKMIENDGDKMKGINKKMKKEIVDLGDSGVSEDINNVNLSEDVVLIENQTDVDNDIIEIDNNTKDDVKDIQTIKVDDTKGNAAKDIPEIITIESSLSSDDTSDCKKRKIMNEEDLMDMNENEINVNTSNNILDNQTDTMSISDVTENNFPRDCSEHDYGDDISMPDEKVNSEEIKSSDNCEETSYITCDKPLELSFNYEKTDKMLNIDLKDNLTQNLDKTDTDVTIVYLTKKYFLAKDLPKYIQGLISLNIMQTKELPLLKCHGVQNGALVYSCHTKKSYEWLENICVTNNITMLAKEFEKLSMKISCYFGFDDEYFFDMLELYNKDISPKKWIILKKNILEDCVIFDVKMDRKSFKYIIDSNLELYSGVDKVSFSIIWE